MERGDSDRQRASKIAVSSTGESLNSQVDPRFGRCAYFVIFGEGDEIRAVSNSGQSAGNGAGILAAQQVIDIGVDTVVTGDVGPNAFRVLGASGVRVFVGASGTVKSAADACRSGKLRQTSSNTSQGHHGRGPRGPGPR